MLVQEQDVVARIRGGCGKGAGRVPDAFCVAPSGQDQKVDCSNESNVVGRNGRRSNKGPENEKRPQDHEVSCSNEIILVGITDCRQNNRSRLIPPTLVELQRLRDKLMQQTRVMPAVEPRQRRTSRRLVNRFPSATRRQIVDAYRAGATAAQLAQEHGVSKGGMISLLRAEGAKIRRQPIPPVTVHQAAQLYESGATIAELAKRFGVAHNTLRLRLIDAGVVMRGRGGRRSDVPLRALRACDPA